ncbi:MAG: Bcr/CflA family efflux MFS transporter [Tannerellaceae bacterium]|nr:Bcr/CflA family efflux MFS transporter [Tannerellaceae bacterium]
MTTSMIGLSLGQLLFGPVSDKYGRRTPLILSLWLLVIATIACIMAWDIYSFIFFRFIQGLAGAGGIVLSRSISSDLFSGKDLVQFFTLIAAVQGLAPIGAPVLGGILLNFTDWQGIFWAILVIGIILLCTSYHLKETLSANKRSRESLLNIFKLLGSVIRNRKFMKYVMLLSFSMAVMFVFIASSSFIFQDLYGLTPFVYSLYFAVNAFALAIGNVLSARFSTPEKAIKARVSGLLSMGILTAWMLLANPGFIYVAVPMLLLLFSAGLTFPSSATLAIECERTYAGSASAVLGTMNFILGGLVTPLVGLGNILWSTAVVILICITLVTLLAISIFKKR